MVDRVSTAGPVWPQLPVQRWAATRDTLHLWTQVVGKVRLALAPKANHWWHVPLYVNGVGLTTSLMPYQGIGVEIVFDFVTHRLLIVTTTGASRQLVLAPRSVADFYAEFRSHLDGLGLDVPINVRPVEVAESIPFPDDVEHASYDSTAVHDFWLTLVHAHRVLSRFRGEFAGKASPVHFFWGGFDLAVSRFSGRPAAAHPGGVPNCPDRVMVEAYSQEVSSCGYWPGGAPEGAFYSYVYPEPAGYKDHPVRPDGAGYDVALGEFLLPYAQVRAAGDPDAFLLEFLRSTWQAAAHHAPFPGRAAAIRDSPEGTGDLGS
jgi:Family of unknown function (DUF5996)